MTVVRVAALALGVQVIAMLAPLAQEQQVPAPAAPPATGRGRGPVPVDPRVQIRMHRFAETNEDIPYALFVSSKVDPKKKAPMIVTLHGLGGTHTTMMRPVALDLAEAGGYILVAPMGYNPRGWYGIPRRPRPAAPPPNATASGTPASGSATTQPRRGGPPPGALNDANDPPNLRELSEKETLEVVDRVRKEFTVDDKRTYLMGHSMGGAGTYYLAMKYPERWAGIAVLAPAAFDLDPNSFAKIPKMPVMVIHGDMDTLVPVSLSRNWVEVMKSLKVPHQYIEVAGGDHGSVITSHQTELFAFFGKHKR
jgi:predicted esterase